LVEHDLFRKTGIHFSGSCSSATTIEVTIESPTRAHEFVNFRSHGAAFSGVNVMSDVNAPSQPDPKRDARTDNQAFTQVEKWLAMIREIDREPPPERKRAE
jgi:hypothetical protein